MSFKPFPTPPKTYQISHLRQEFGVTSRALRHYEELGLLNPARHDGARIYSKRDRARLALILHGRGVGIALEEIGRLLDLYESDGKAVQSARLLSTYRRQIRLLEARRDEAERGIANLRVAIEQLSANEPAHAPAADDGPRVMTVAI